MANLRVQVNGRDYAIACGDGEEQHVRELAAYIDGRLKEVVAQVGQVGETQLLLMTALNIADDLSGAVTELEQVQANTEAAPASDDSGAASALEALAERVERIAARLEKP